MKIDTFTTQGLHEINQDYILQNKKEIIIADGCSSEKNTDVGARILCHLATKWSFETWSCEEFIFHAQDICDTLGLPKECLCSTLLILSQDISKYYINIYGDGIIFIKYTDGSIYLDKISFQDECPYYLYYLLDEEIIYRKDRITETFWINNKNITGVEINIENDKEEFLTHAITIDKKDVSFIGIATDGINSIVNENGNLLKVQQIISDILTFPNLTGEFLKRRMNFFLKNKKILDDLTIGIMNCT